MASGAGGLVLAPLSTLAVVETRPGKQAAARQRSHVSALFAKGFEATPGLSQVAGISSSRQATSCCAQTDT